MRCLSSIRIGLVVLVVMLAAAAVDADRPRVYCIQGATLLPAPGETIENGTLVIRDGLIEAIGPKATAPPDAVVIDGEGLWVYPGLIDPVVEFGESSGGGGAEQQPSAMRGMGGGQQQKPGPVHPLSLVHPEQRASDRLLPFDGDRQRQAERMRELGFTTVLVVPSSGVFRGTSAAVLLKDETPVSEIILRDDVAQHLAFDHTRFGGSYPTSLMGAAATIRQVVLDAERHIEWQWRYEDNPQGMARPEYVAAYEALAAVVAGDQLVVFHTDSALEVLLAQDLAIELGLEASIVGSGTEWEVVEQLRSLEGTLILPIAFPEKPKVGDDDEALEVTVQTMRRYLEAPANAALLADSGVRIALTTHGLKTLSDFKKNLGKMFEAGLTEAAALAALTTVPAEVLGIDNISGTLEPGKIANVAVFDGPIFAEKTTAKYIFIDGFEYRIEAKKKPKGGDPEAVAEPRGEWAVVFEMPDGGSERQWKIEGEKGALTGTAETRGGTVTFEDVRLEGNMLTVVFPGRGGRGSMELMVVIIGETFEGQAEFGPRTVTVTGDRTSGPEGGAS
jgi:imidazolonepropionase-like amidohydrolase